MANSKGTSKNMKDLYDRLGTVEQDVVVIKNDVAYLKDASTKHLTSCPAPELRRRLADLDTHIQENSIETENVKASHSTLKNFILPITIVGNVLLSAFGFSIITILIVLFSYFANVKLDSASEQIKTHISNPSSHGGRITNIENQIEEIKEGQDEILKELRSINR